ncbi:arylamine N-acetyltransferase family protein [Nocardia transvalensis]|uniref:arylamine N-acetyltransferase family protein n=1 Tax=Nocardia transvalensis TaxID=37333 RepID=UPI001894E154|nr:arylamine N-acetyltransferase [Nocardia transvalensis]MBF6330361.1 arylamine N-acetyltransferase [Nocardia transvalensis]
MSSDQFQIERLDVAAYLDRIGCTDLKDAAPDENLLRAVHRAHSLSIPFENLDILLGRGIRLDIDSLQDKLVRRGRGGYCHEHNLLLAAALERLGFTVTRLSARILSGNAARRQPRTHIALRVAAGDAVYLADVGLGAEGLVDPVPWREGEYADPDGWLHGIRRHPDAWELTVRRPNEQARPMYRITEEPSLPIDFEVASHWTSTHPRSPFVTQPVVQRRGADVRLILSRDTLVEKFPDRDIVTRIGRNQLGSIITRRVGLPLTPDELAQLAG